MMKIYQLKNTKIPYWHPPVFSPLQPDDMKSTTYRECILDPEKAKQSHLDECELYYIGDFDDLKGELKLLKDKEFLLDIKAECFKQ